MALAFEKFVALRYLRSKRKEVFISIITVISVLGVGLSVMVLDMVMAVMTGFETALQTKLVDASAHITLRRFGGDIENYESLIDLLESVEGVTGAYPYTYNQAMLTSESGAHGLLIRGVANHPVPVDKLAKMVRSKEAVQDLFTPAEIQITRPDGSEDAVKLPTLIVGRELRDRMNLAQGTPVTLFAPRFTASPQGLVPKLRRFVVIDFYRSGLIEYESGLAYASLKDAQTFFGLGAGVTGIEVSVKDLFQAPAISRKILEKLSNLDVQYYATDWTEQNKPLWDAIQLEKRVYFIVLLLLILVASFSIVSTLVMVVMEKGRDIAVLKSMGATDRSILMIFLTQGTLIGSVGIAVGTVLGYLGCIGLREYGFEIDERVFSLNTVPVQIEPMNMAIIAVAAFIITALAGVYPAYRASRLRPADALRFE